MKRLRYCGFPGMFSTSLSVVVLNLASTRAGGGEGGGCQVSDRRQVFVNLFSYILFLP